RGGCRRAPEDGCRRHRRHPYRAGVPRCLSVPPRGVAVPATVTGMVVAVGVAVPRAVTGPGMVVESIVVVARADARAGTGVVLVGLVGLVTVAGLVGVVLQPRGRGLAGSLQ